jgi:hypothetical protein
MHEEPLRCQVAAWSSTGERSMRSTIQIEAIEGMCTVADERDETVAEGTVRSHLKRQNIDVVGIPHKRLGGPQPGLVSPGFGPRPGPASRCNALNELSEPHRTIRDEFSGRERERRTILFARAFAPRDGGDNLDANADRAEDLPGRIADGPGVEFQASEFIIRRPAFERELEDFGVVGDQQVVMSCSVFERCPGRSRRFHPPLSHSQ